MKQYCKACGAEGPTITEDYKPSELCPACSVAPEKAHVAMDLPDAAKIRGIVRTAGRVEVALALAEGLERTEISGNRKKILEELIYELQGLQHELG